MLKELEVEVVTPECPLRHRSLHSRVFFSTMTSVLLGPARTDDQRRSSPYGTSTSLR